MDNNQLTCLIVGETPNVQFMAWILSLANAFIILTSQSLSMDGLVGWKSTKLGANFYKPNIFTKNVEELIDKITVVKEDLTKSDVGGRVSICKYNIDIIIISSISLDKLKETCRDLKKFANPNTIILVSADFGSELELIALKEFGTNCHCVTSILTDVECRQLSLGSYTLVNDNYCKIKIGISYLMKNFPMGLKADNIKDEIKSNNLNKLLGNNLQKFQEICCTEGNDNKLDKFIKMLQLTPWITIDKISNPTKMSLLIWKNIIPKISLNLLTIIYEQFDYNKMLNVKSTNAIFQDLVIELLNICQVQNGYVIDKFIKREMLNESLNSYGSSKSKINLTLDMIDFEKIISICNTRREQLNKSTVNEHPEYLSLPFETYCFYHRFEYPAHILLYQPLQLGQKYSINCSNLNFLYGVYTRLLSLTGLSINGGRYQTKVQLFNKDLTLNIDNDDNDNSKNSSEENIKLNQFRERRYHHHHPEQSDKIFDDNLENNNSFTKINIDQDNNAKNYGRNNKTTPNSEDGSFSNLTPNLTTFNEISEMYNMYESAICSDQSGTDNISDDSANNDKIIVDYKNSQDKKSSKSQTFKDNSTFDDDNGRNNSIMSMGIIGIPRNYRNINKKKRDHNDKRNGIFFDEDMSDDIRYEINEKMKRDNSQENIKKNLELQIRNDYNLNFDQISIQNNGISDLQLPMLQMSNIDAKPQSQEEKIKKQLSFAHLNGQIWQQINQTNIRNGIIPMPDQHYQNIEKYRKYDDLAKTLLVLNRGNKSMNIIPYTTTRYGTMDLLQNLNMQNLKGKEFQMQERLSRIKLKQIKNKPAEQEQAEKEEPSLGL